MQFDFKRITLGNVLSIATMLTTVFIAYSNLKTDINVIKNDISWIKFNLETKTISRNQ